MKVILYLVQTATAYRPACGIHYVGFYDTVFMTTPELFGLIFAAFGLIVASLSALAAFRFAGSAQSAQQWAKESAHTAATLAASKTAAEVLVEVQRIKSLAGQAKTAYQTLEVFSGSYQNSGVQQAISNALSLAERADATATSARTFGDAASTLSDAGLGEVARVQLSLTAAHAQITAWRVELEQSVAFVEAQNLQHRQRALQK